MLIRILLYFLSIAALTSCLTGMKATARVLDSNVDTILLDAKVWDIAVVEEPQMLVLATEQISPTGSGSELKIGQGVIQVFEMFPARLRQSIKLDFIPIIVRNGPKGNIYIAGRKLNPDRTSKGTNFLILEKQNSADDIDPYKIKFYGQFDKSMLITEISISEKGLIALTDLHRLEFLLQYADRLPSLEVEVGDELINRDIVFNPELETVWLTCGRAVQVSIVDSVAEPFFIASNFTRGGIEAGWLGIKNDLECANLIAEPASQLDGRLYMHGYFFNKNSAAAKVFGDDYLGTIAYIDDSGESLATNDLVRSEDGPKPLKEFKVKIREYVTTFDNSRFSSGLVATRDGSKIIVANDRDRRMLVFSYDGRKLSFIGWFGMRSVPNAFALGPSGRMFAFASSVGEAEFEVVAIRDVDEIRMEVDLPYGKRTAGWTFYRLQQALKDKGNKSIVIDGKLGPETIRALRTFVSNELGTEAEAMSPAALVERALKALLIQ